MPISVVHSALLLKVGSVRKTVFPCWLRASKSWSQLLAHSVVTSLFLFTAPCHTPPPTCTHTPSPHAPTRPRLFLSEECTIYDTSCWGVGFVQACPTHVLIVFAPAAGVNHSLHTCSVIPLIHPAPPPPSHPLHPQPHLLLHEASTLYNLAGV